MDMTRSTPEVPVLWSALAASAVNGSTKAALELAQLVLEATR